jgi:PAS domain S-box-containing protein
MDVISDRTDVLKILPEAAVELCTALFRNSPAGIYITRDGKFIYTNIEFRHITGYSQDELSGKDYQRLINPRYRQRPKQNMASLFEEDEDTNHEFKITTSDGKKKWISEKITYFKYGGNWLTLGHWLDISGHHSVEKAWREAERRFQLAFEDLSTGLAIIGTDGIFLKVNKSFCDMVGYEDSEILESRFDEMLPPGDREISGDIMAVFLSLEKPELPVQRLLQTRDGRTVWTAMSISLIGDSEAGPSYFIVNFQDITEQKRIEDGLKEEELLYRSVVDLSLDPVAIADLDCRLTYVSQKLLLLLGYQKADLLGRDAGCLVTSGESSDIRPRVTGIVRQGIPAEITCSLQKKDGAALPVSMNVSWINNEKGALASIVLSLRQSSAASAAPHDPSVNVIEPAGTASPDKTIETPVAVPPAEERPRQAGEFENSPTSIILINEDTTIAAVNAAFETLSGYTREEIEGKKSWIEFVAEEDRPRLKRYYVLRRVEPGSAPDTFEFKFTGRDGNVRDVVVYISSLPGSGQQSATLLDLAGYRKDDTQLTPAETGPVQEPGYLSDAILEKIPAAIITTDLDGTIRLASQRTLDIMASGKAGALTGKSYFSLIRPGLVEDVREYVETLKTAGQIGRREFDFVRFDGNIVQGEVSASVAHDRDGLPAGLIFAIRNTAHRQLAEQKAEQSLEHLHKTLHDVITAMSKIIEMRDPYTFGHQERVSALAGAIAGEMGLSEEQLQGIEIAAKIHDIGKVYVPMEILSKPGRLSSIERQIIQAHARGSYDILKSVEFPWPVAEIALQHHERMDGSGYPGGLKGNEIRLEARILMVADVVEAMASDRPYRPSLGIEAALNEIKSKSGTLYDPAIAGICIKLFGEKGFSFEEQVRST